MDGTVVSGEVVTAAVALAGLILLYLGTLVTGYASFQATEQKTVRGRMLARAWIAFVGMVLSVLSAAMGILGKWLPCPCLSNGAIIVLFVALLWGILVAILTIREIR